MKIYLKKTHVDIWTAEVIVCEKMNESRIKTETSEQIPSTSSFSLKEQCEGKERDPC